MASESSEHRYDVEVEWTGNRGTGTLDYRAYGRDYTIASGGKPPILGSADPVFRCDARRWNPEDLLVAALSACHKLWYLHPCAANGIAVMAYADKASGTMVEEAETGGRFTGVILRPEITIRATDDVSLAHRLHRDAHDNCFIANSVNFPVLCEPVISQAAG